MRKVRMGLALFTTALVIRAVQMTAVSYQGEWWWFLEATRWTLHMSTALIAVVVIGRLFHDLADYRERLSKIEENARWARLELDVREFRGYADRV